MTGSSDLGRTARWAAAVRARETKRGDSLFADPWAETLAGDEGAEWAAEHPEDATIVMAIRTRFFDDFLVRIAPANPQIVLVAAGLDTRAFRLAWPTHTSVFELDRPDVLEHKESVLAGIEPICNRHVVAVDLTADWTGHLFDSGFDASRPSVWLLEGFLFYLTLDDITAILDQVTLLASVGSHIGFDIINRAMLTSPWTRAWVDMQSASGAPWVGTLDDPVGFLAERGWNATVTQAGEPDANYGRWKLPILPLTAPEIPHDWFVTASK